MRFNKIRRGMVLFFVANLIFGTLFLFPKSAAAANIYNWERVVNNGIIGKNNSLIPAMYEYSGYLYAGIGNLSTGGQIYRSANGTDWEIITQNGFNDTSNEYFISFISFKGYLYTSTGRDLDNLGAEIWRSQTGAAGTWELANPLGFGIGEDPDTNECIYDMAILGDYLYVGTENSTTGAQIWRSSDGATWQNIVPAGFTDGANTGIWSLKVFNGKLFAGVANGASGAKIFSSPDGQIWSKIVEFGGTNYGVASLEEHNGYLYAGMANIEGGELWRSATGDVDSWHRVFNKGFNSVHNILIGFQGISSDNKIWLGTENATVRIIGVNNIKQQLLTPALKDANGFVSDGAALLYSEDGTNWQQEGENGFGNKNNIALFTMVFHNQLYIGFSNAQEGFQIWRGTPQVASLPATGANYLPILLLIMLVSSPLILRSAFKK